MCFAFRPPSVLTVAAGLLLAGPTLADAPGPRVIGQKVPDLTWTDAAGQSLRLHGLREQKAIVLVFLSFDCPVSNSYCRPLADLHKELSKRGVAFVGLVPLPDVTAAEAARKARDFKLPFAVYLDKDLKAANAVRAEVTPEVFVLDGDFVLRYRGRIDDAWAARLKQNHQATSEDLRQALSEVISGRRVGNPVTEAVGCPILREAPPAGKTGPVAYYRDVLPILQNRCQSCHRPGEVGPFSLLTYRQAVNWAADIKAFTQSGRMPPWKITGGAAFHNDRRMPAGEVATLAAWVDGGTPAGDPKEAPPAKHFPQGWQLGQPDLVLTVPDDFQVGPTGKDVFRCFVLPTGLDEDRYVAAVDIRPGNPRIVHHALLFVDATGQGRKLEQKEQARKSAPGVHDGSGSEDKGPGYTVQMGVGFAPQGGLSGWAPGQRPRYLPDGFGYYLPKGSDVVMQVHYHRNGRPEKDRTRVGLYFAKSSSCKPLQNGTLFGSQGGNGPFRLFFSIPAGAERFKLTGRQWTTEDSTLFGITPHMHLLGKAIKVTATPPGGKAQPLLEIGDWDYNWQETYVFKEPIRLPAGTQLEVEALFDNSPSNPNNPFSPPRRVSFGEQTTNEMCFVFLAGTSAHPNRRRLPLSLSDPAAKTK